MRVSGLLPVLLLAAACGSDVGSSADLATTTTTAAPAAATYGHAPCPPATPPAETPHSFEAPKKCIQDGVDYGAVLSTTEGDITIDLLEDQAPVTVNNFVVLARWGWFDGDDFHRVVPGFVAQAGDRFGDPQGSGTPGYVIPDELPSAVSDYVPGSVAMANRGPDTGSSQFFLCTDCSKLPSAAYARFGQITAGMDVLAQIDALGQGDGPPGKPIGIRKVTITEK
jgi:cyclophilin family peptidyl-prolyl cis-trans isomerase